MEKTDWGYYVSLLGIAILVVWAILKSIGAIHSPTYQEMIPVFSIAIAFGGMVSTLKHHGKEISDLKDETKGIKDKVHSLDKEIEVVKEKVFHIDKDVEILKDRQVRT